MKKYALICGLVLGLSFGVCGMAFADDTAAINKTITEIQIKTTMRYHCYIS